MSFNVTQYRAATYDGKQVICPNASLLGFNLGRTCRVGDFFTATEGGRSLLCRMIARVCHSARQGADAPEIKNHIAAVVLAEDAGSIFFRWISPIDVTSIQETPNELAAFFFAPDLTRKYDAETLVRLVDYGTLSAHYIGGVDKRVAEWNQEKREAARQKTEDNYKANKEGN